MRAHLRSEHGIREFRFTEILDFEAYEGAINQVVGLPPNAQQLLRAHVQDREFNLNPVNMARPRRIHPPVLAPENTSSNVTLDDLKTTLRSFSTEISTGECLSDFIEKIHTISVYFVFFRS